MKNPKKCTSTFYVKDEKWTWREINPKDIPREKKIELCDRFALALGYKRDAT